MSERTYLVNLGRSRANADEQRMGYRQIKDLEERLKAAQELLTACEAARDYCSAISKEAPSPFNKTPLHLLNAAVAKAKP